MVVRNSVRLAPSKHLRKRTFLATPVLGRAGEEAADSVYVPG